MADMIRFLLCTIKLSLRPLQSIPYANVNRMETEFLQMN